MFLNNKSLFKLKLTNSEYNDQKSTCYIVIKNDYKCNLEIIKISKLMQVQ